MLLLLQFFMDKFHFFFWNNLGWSFTKLVFQNFHFWIFKFLKKLWNFHLHRSIWKLKLQNATPSRILLGWAPAIFPNNLGWSLTKLVFQDGLTGQPEGLPTDSAHFVHMVKVGVPADDVKRMLPRKRSDPDVVFRNWPPPFPKVVADRRVPIGRLTVRIQNDALGLQSR